MRKIVNMVPSRSTIRLLKAFVVVAAVTAVCAVVGLRDRTRPAPHGESAAATPAAAAAPGVETPDHELKVLEAAARKKPGHAPVLFRLATLAEAAGRAEDARKYLEQILRGEPQNLEARLELGKVMFGAGDVAAALTQTNLVLKSHPDHPDALYNLGAIYGNLGDERLARENWMRLLATSPSSESGRRARQALDRLGGGPGDRP